MKKIIQQGAEALIFLDLGTNKVIKSRIRKSYRIQILDEKLRKTRTKSEAKIILKLQNIIYVPKIIKTDDKQEIIMEYIKGKKLSDNLELLDYRTISKVIGETIAKLHNQDIIHGDLTTSNMIYAEDENLINKPNIPLNQSISQNLDWNEKVFDAISSGNIGYSKPPINNYKIAIEKADKRRKFLICNLNINSKIENLRSLQNREIEKAAERSEAGKLYFIDFGLAFHSKKIEDKAVDLHLLQQALEAKHFTIWEECWKIILDDYEKTANQGKEIIHRIKIIESRGRYKEKY